MIDVLNGQLEVQDIELKNGITGPHAPEILNLLTKVMSTPWFSDLSNGLEEVAFLNSMNENPELHDDSITVIEQLLTDLFQLIHGTLKKLVVNENSEEENNDEMNGCSASGSTEAENKTNMLKKGAPGLGGMYLVHFQNKP